jgi:hypothetical protein
MLSRGEHHGWDAVWLTTPQLELIAPLDIGPRIVSLRRAGGRNVLAELEAERGGRGELEFCLRGGHRLWHAPEHPVRTYQPDNRPVALAELGTGRGFELCQEVEAATGLRKALRVELVDECSLRLTHRLANLGHAAVECAAWALTMLRVGGRSIVPLPPRQTHAENLLPRFSLVQWAYTDLSLPAWRFQPSFLAFDTREVTGPQKLGLTDYAGWSAYWIEGDLFVKQAQVCRGAAYPDGGCPFETFAAEEFLELETLGPLQTLAPREDLVHVETWGLLADLPEPVDEATYRAQILPAVESWMDAIADGRGARAQS